MNGINKQKNGYNIWPDLNFNEQQHKNKIYKDFCLFLHNMNPAMMAQPMMGGSNANMMDSLKSNMMTMLMINNMNGTGDKTGKGGSNNMFSMIYVFIATSVVDFVMKNAPFAFNFFMKQYTDKLENIKKDLSSVTKDLTDNKIKKKTASITVTINVNSPENALGQALLDFITNNKNTTHVSYIRENFILNQKDVINIDDDIFARMTQSTSADQPGMQGSTSTNSNTGSGNVTGAAIVQVIEIYSFSKTTDELRNFLDDIRQKYTINVKNKLGNKRYYFNMHPLNVPMNIDNRKDLSRLPPNFTFIMKHFQTNRKFSNLFGEDIDIIRTRVNFFCKNRKWYDEKGIPYTLGLLLSGSPGTGKTSTIKCLANETNRHICNINLNNDMSKTQLENLFFNENLNVMNPSTGQMETYCIPLDQRIYVLEDVDCQSDIVMERALKKTVEKKESNESVDKKVLEHYEDKHKVDLSFLLNLLDGILENPGRIVIMTSNFPDTLDSALIRPGRIDVIAKFRNCTNNTVIAMIEFFYDIKMSIEDKDRIIVLKEEIITPAELSKVLFENFSDYLASILHMENLSETKIRDEIMRKEQIEKEKNNNLLLNNTAQMKADEFIASMGTFCPNELSDQFPKGQNAVSIIDHIKENLVDGSDGFSEQKGSDSNSDEIITLPETPESKLKEDIVYVFVLSVLSQRANVINIKKRDTSYYSELLEERVFRLKNEFLVLKNEVFTDFKEQFELKTSLEQRAAHGSKVHKCDWIYKNKLISFLNPEFLKSSGVFGQLIIDKVIEPHMPSYNDVIDQIPSNLTLASSPFGSGSLSSTYSAY